MPDFLMPESSCPYCGHKMNACFTPSELKPPKKGDLSVCGECCELLKFDENRILQKLEPDEIFKVILEAPKTYAELMKIKKAALESKK